MIITDQARPSLLHSQIALEVSNCPIKEVSPGPLALTGPLIIKIVGGVKSIVLVELSPNMSQLLSSAHQFRSYAHFYVNYYSIISQWAELCKISW